MDKAQQKATEIVKQLTLTEKLGLLSTSQKAIPRFKLREFSIGGEAAHGIVDREHYHTTSFPLPLTLSQTWDPELLHEVGTVISDEARGLYNATGRNHWLMPWAPTIDMERDPLWGRNEEGYGEDPYLTGQVAGGLIKGLQGDETTLKVAAAPKHFFANNTEAGRGSESNTVVPRMKHEYYLKPFKFAFRDSNAQSMMTAYNGINGVPAMQSPELLETVKGRWQMNGCIVTDGGALTLNIEDYHYYDRFDDAVADALLHGIDCFVDDADKVETAAQSALDRKLIQEVDLDRAIIATLTVRIRLGALAESTPYDQFNLDDVGTTAHDELVQKVYAAGTVLLKNDQQALPLAAADNLLVTGPLANRFVRDWYATLPMNKETIYEGLHRKLGTKVTYVNSNDFVQLDAIDDQKLTADLTQRTYEVERWQEGIVFLRDRKSKRYLRFTENAQFELGKTEVYDWVVREAFYLDEKQRLHTIDHDFNATDINSLHAGGHAVASFATLKIMESGIERVKTAATKFTKTLIVCGNHPMVNARETQDRQDLALAPSQVALCAGVAQTTTMPVGLIIGGYPSTVEQLPVAALLFTGYAGQSLGTALTKVLYGEVAPTGKLSQTWFNASWQHPSLHQYDIEKTQRTYQYADPTKVAYPFGYGLTYGQLAITAVKQQQVGEKLIVTVTVQNSEQFAVTDTVQAYLNASLLSNHQDRQQLIAFQKVTIAAQTVKTVTLTANLADFKWYHPATKTSYFPVGTYQLTVGFSATDSAYTEEVHSLAQDFVVPTTFTNKIPAHAFDDYHQIELTSRQGYYELVELKKAGFIEFYQVQISAGSLLIRLFADQDGLLRLMDSQTQEIIGQVAYKKTDQLQTVQLSVHNLDQKNVRINVTTSALLLDLVKKV